jgi:FkbM family methyltransferase
VSAASLARRLRRRLLPAHVRADIRDQELLAALLERSLRPDSDCLDIGAHSGAVLGEMVRLAPRGRHVAWEPLPELAALLRSRFPAVEVREAALSDAAGERDFARVVGAPGWSGFVERPTPGERIEWLRVRVERLDDALPDGVRPAFVKLDVEGAEAEVLRGAREVLARFRPTIAFEHGFGSADPYGTTPSEIAGLLGELGFELRGLDGDGPYDPARLAELFSTGERVNFVAWPA